MENKMNLNITNGSRTIWVSSDGRKLKVEDMPKPYLENVLCKLWKKAEEAWPGGTDNDLRTYLHEYCPTYTALNNYGNRYKLLTVTGKPMRLDGIIKQTIYATPVQLPFNMNDYSEVIDKIATLVAAKLKPAVKKRRVKR